jgi:hypothetical protein
VHLILGQETLVVLSPSSRTDTTVSSTDTAVWIRLLKRSERNGNVLASPSFAAYDDPVRGL